MPKNMRSLEVSSGGFSGVVAATSTEEAPEDGAVDAGDSA